ncbi:unnamed protein product [Effrenium voratum]|uniref:Peptidyl-prolyl cis-trans isomerase n=1 Tax=Effrenium voratum TaxID=2562239 RepID=A0AA36IEU1_9DINO|nr:unnamed protein product [Effrenium voratum]CAJ1459580.1 unnamed protein product [Effrenium voratum]
MSEAVAAKTWGEQVAAHKSALLALRARLQNVKSQLPRAQAALSDTATCLSRATAAVEEWSESRSEALMLSARTLTSIQEQLAAAKEALEASAFERGDKSMPMMRLSNGKPAVDFSPFTRARWEAERRKGESMLASEGDGVKVYLQDVPKPFPEEKACSQVRGRHVLVNNAEKAKKIYLEMSVTGTADRGGFLRHASCATFASLASERSECPSARQGGDLGWISKDPNPSKLNQVALHCPRSACSPPFKSGSGFHLFFCEERR